MATIDALRALDAETLASLPREFEARVNDAFAHAGIDARCVATTANAHLVFDVDDVATGFYRAAAAAGVLFYCFNDVNLMYAHMAVWDEALDRIDLRRRLAFMRALEVAGVSEDAVFRYLRRHRIASPDPASAAPLVRHVASRLMRAEHV